MRNATCRSRSRLWMSLGLVSIGAACGRDVEFASPRVLETTTLWSMTVPKGAHWADASLHPGTGSVLLLDRASKIVTRLSASGVPLGTIDVGDSEGVGRPGLVGYAADSVWVLDLRRRELTWMDTLGVRGRVVKFGREFVELTDWYTGGGPPLANGGMLQWPAIESQQALTDGLQVPLMITQEGDSRPRVIEWLTLPGAYAVEVPLASGGKAYTSQPFNAEPLIGASDDGEFFVVVERPPPEGNVAEYIVRFFDPSGRQDHRYVVSAGEPIDPSARLAAFRASYHDWALQAGSALSDQQFVDAIWKPRFLPPVKSMILDPDGAWVELSGTQGTMTRWHRIDRLIGLVGSVTLPAEGVVLAGAADRLLYLESTSDVWRLVMAVVTS